MPQRPQRVERRQGERSEDFYERARSLIPPDARFHAVEYYAGVDRTGSRQQARKDQASSKQRNPQFWDAFRAVVANNEAYGPGSGTEQTNTAEGAAEVRGNLVKNGARQMNRAMNKFCIVM